MVPAGKCFCPRCGNVFSSLYFHSGVKKTGVFLTRSLPFFKLKAKPYHAQGEPEKVKLHDVITNPKTGFIESIECVFSGSDKPLPMVRCCPNPECHEQMKNGYGMYNTFVIGTAGEVDAGKSSWFGSIAYTPHAADVAAAGYPYRLEFLNASNSYERSENTTENSLGNTKLLRIHNTQDNKVVADVILIDVSGETSGRSFEDNQYKRRILSPHDGYPGADAMVFLAPADLLAQNLGGHIRTQDLEGGPSQIFNSYKSDGLLEGKPVAYICSCTDKLLDMRLKFQVEADDQSMVTLLDQNTFTDSRSYDPELLTDRMAKEHFIASKLARFALTDPKGEKIRGFMVQSCTGKETVDNQDPARMYENTMNVMDPLLWLLNTLKIFPLRREEQPHGTLDNL